jgi:LysM repeat protein
MKVWNKLKSTRLRVGMSLTIVQPVKRYFKPEQEPTLATNDSIIAKNISLDSIPKKQQAAMTVEDFHTVQRGDTLWNIARLYNMDSVDELRKMNGLQKQATLVPGQRLRVKKKSVE